MLCSSNIKITGGKFSKLHSMSVTYCLLISILGCCLVVMSVSSRSHLTFIVAPAASVSSLPQMCCFRDCFGLHRSMSDYLTDYRLVFCVVSIRQHWINNSRKQWERESAAAAREAVNSGGEQHLTGAACTSMPVLRQDVHQELWPPAAHTLTYRREAVSVHRVWSSFCPEVQRQEASADSQGMIAP